MKAGTAVCLAHTPPCVQTATHTNNSVPTSWGPVPPGSTINHVQCLVTLCLGCQLDLAAVHGLQGAPVVAVCQLHAALCA